MDNNEANQAKLDRLIVEAQWRIPVGKTTKTKHGTARWNGLAWVYGR